ncbi:hypothetical protein H0H92_004514 [Tricholoma furcatifolium]|nr:hypothetical protein H0H92_004514 [Tricholoma furcatifolium]
MPVTKTTKRQRTPINGSTTVITPLTPLVTHNRRNTDTTSKKISNEVIEISSDEDDVVVPQVNSVLVDLRRRIKRLKEENAILKTQLEMSSHELPSARDEGKLVLDWFNTTLARFITAHPHYNGVQNQNERRWEAMLQNPAYQIPLYYAQMRQPQAPRPQYTCPTCREPVKNCPVEDFALKALIRAITTATGESSPKKTEVQNKGKSSASNVGHWDAFFPRVT